MKFTSAAIVAIVTVTAELAGAVPIVPPPMAHWAAEPFLLPNREPLTSHIGTNGTLLAPHICQPGVPKCSAFRSIHWLRYFGHGPICCPDQPAVVGTNTTGLVPRDDKDKGKTKTSTFSLAIPNLICFKLARRNNLVHRTDDKDKGKTTVVIKFSHWGGAACPNTTESAETRSKRDVAPAEPSLTQGTASDVQIKELSSEEISKLESQIIHGSEAETETEVELQSEANNHWYDPTWTSYCSQPKHDPGLCWTYWNKCVSSSYFEKGEYCKRFESPPPDPKPPAVI